MDDGEIRASNLMAEAAALLEDAAALAADAASARDLALAIKLEATIAEAGCLVVEAIALMR